MNKPKVSFLPEEIINEINDDRIQELVNENKLIQIEFNASANTKSREYRCRKLDYNSINMMITSNIDEVSDDVEEAIKNYINVNLHFGCSDGKYPDIELSGLLKQNGITYDSEYNMGYVSLSGHVWAYIL